MESMSIDPAVAAIGAQLADIATRGLGSGTAASASLTALVPAGAEEVSAQAAISFAAEGASALALNAAAQQELARAGMALTDIARMYSEVDGAAAGRLAAAGNQSAEIAFAGGPGQSVGAGLLRSDLLPGAGGSAARTALMANLIDGVAPSTPSTTASPAASAASTLLGAASGPLGAIGSVGQGASAGGAVRPGLASSLAEDKDKSEPEDPADQQPGEQLA
jgi:hypothetical protein